MRKPKTPLLVALQKAVTIVRASGKTGIPVNEWQELYRINSISRKNFIRHTAFGAAAIGAGSLLQACKKETTFTGGLKRDHKIAIIGAGIAGLHAAYILKKAGYYSYVYEASNRAGGRMFSATNLMWPGLVTELGGEFIDSTHTDMLNLASEFGFTLLDRQAPAEAALNEAAFWFNNQSYSFIDLLGQVQLHVAAFNADIATLPTVITYHNPGNGLNFDHLSITEYLTQKGVTGWLTNFIVSAFATEYGLDASQQTALNFLTLAGTDTQFGGLNIFGSGDERYKIEGGNQQIPVRLSKEVPEVNYNCRLQRIRKGGGGYLLKFSNGEELFFEYVLITLPFSMLRQVEIDLDIPTVKKQAIEQLNLGTNAKLIAGFNTKKWRELGYAGFTYTDQAFLGGWDSSQMQAGTNGSFTFFTGGTEGKYLNQLPVSQKVQEYLPMLDKIYPGVAAQFNGNAQIMHWPGYQFSLGSYQCYTPGQWTAMGGAEIETVDKMYFAGEHCSYDFQGYMNGGAETGRRAAEAMLLKLRG